MLKFLLFCSLALFTGAQHPLQLPSRDSILHSFKGTSAKVHQTPDLEDLDIEPRLRLPRNVIPISYDLELFPILDEIIDPVDPSVSELYTAPGNVTIRIRCIENTSVIRLHGIMARIRSIKVSGRIETNWIQDDQNSETQFLTIILTSALTAGQEYDLEIDFVARILQGIPIGFYLTDLTGYDPANPEPRFIATTQFASTFARFAFPCFDEPDLKATFNIRIKRLEKYNSISNTNLLQSQFLDDGYRLDIFNTTPPMSTYIVAFAVTDFGFKEASFRDIPVKTYAPLNRIEEATYSANLTSHVVPYFEELLDFQYPLTKVDSIALPFFYFGAMENWGFINYRSDFLLYSPEKTTEISRYFIDNIIAHECAHFHFGNLVTKRTWPHVYLNEGFATYFSYLGQINSEFEARKMFLNDAVHYSKKIDALPPPYSHPVVDESVQTPDQILANYDGIVYEKGASLLYMLEGLLGGNTLLRGIRIYIKTHAYANVHQDDLFEILTRVAHEDGTLPSTLTIKQIMDTWTLKRGFPLLRVSRAGSSRVLISQEKYMANPDEEVDFDELWYLPIEYQVDNSPDNQEIMIPSNIISFTIEHDTSKWILMNPNSYGYYRTIYDEPLTGMLKAKLDANSSLIPFPARAALLDDYFSAAFDGYIELGRALDLTSILGQDSELLVFQTFFNNINYPFLMMTSNDLFQKFIAFYQPLFEKALEAHGLETLPGDKGNVIILRSYLLDWLCTFESEVCIEYSLALLRDWEATGTNSIPVEQFPSVICAGVAGGGSEQFEFFLSQYETETDSELKALYVRAMGCTKEPTLFQRMLELAMDEENGYSKLDGILAVQSLCASAISRNTALSFIRDQPQTKIDYFGPGIMSYPFATLGVYWNADFTELVNFKDELVSLNIPGFEDHLASIENSLTTIASNKEWFDKYSDPLNEWFDKELSI